MRFIYNLKETKTPAGKGQAFAHMTRNPIPQLQFHMKNMTKLVNIVPTNKAEAKQLEAEIWMCNNKIEYWKKRVAKKPLEEVIVYVCS